MSDNKPGAEPGALPPTEGQQQPQQQSPQRMTVAVSRSPNTQLQLAQVVGTNQYVLTTQAQNIPPLTQFASTTSPSTIARILNITSLRTANLSNQSIVNALTKPRTTNVRTQLFPAIPPATSAVSQSQDPAATSSSAAQSTAPPLVGLSQQQPTTTPVTSPPGARKRTKPEGWDEYSAKQKRAFLFLKETNRDAKEMYYRGLAEAYFTDSGGNPLEYYLWRKRPRTAHFEAYLRLHAVDAPKPAEVVAEPEPSPAYRAPITTTITTTTTTSSSISVKDTPAQKILESRLQTGPSGTPAPNAGARKVVLTPLRMPSVTTTTNTTTTPSPVHTSAPHTVQPVLKVTPSVPSPPVQKTPPTIPPPVITSTPSTSTQNNPITPASSGPETPKLKTTPNVVSITTTKPSAVQITTLTTTTSSTPTTTVVETAVNTASASSAAVTPVVNKIRTITTLGGSGGTGNAEQIVEKAKQEAYVIQRIADLQREGLWPEKRLPKVQEVPRCKSHWDYLLEEMVWLAADFAQERKWKKAAAKKCARMVQKYFQDKAVAAQKAEKAQELQLRRIASFIAKEIKTFWGNVEKLVEFKQQTRLEEKRKQALDQHLSFIVDQTEKYSQLLAEGMNKSGTVDASTPKAQSRVPTPAPAHQSDDEFNPADSSSDDESTIAQAEVELADTKQQVEEVAALQRESEMALEDFLNELPKDYLANRENIKLSDDESEPSVGSASAAATGSGGSSDNKVTKSDSKNKKKDEDFVINSDESEADFEETIDEEEKLAEHVDHKQELDDLQAENEMSVEELRKKYKNAPPVPLDTDESDEADESDASASSEEEADGTSDSESDESEAKESEDEGKIGLKMLVEDQSIISDKQKTDDDQMINDVAALAESIQPKGNTLSSTSVVTPVPFLLKHSLREYQHIGLDWLTTMYERKLNGILADEMGLGKTIQTIALLAHLACEKGDWGPHLIIVPTSVMLNWEMECKKWCPGFKILTYYGTQKERKLKRTGWTKPNAFHICITSYKLVIQDHQSFRRKKWKYLILDEAQNIKNFKSQRWQLLLNFQTQQRLLLTGTPLQNNLMELWSLMHFLMPNVFQSHREFKEWFSNPVTGMIEGNSEYNESIIKRLHKVLRPFLLRRLKSEVEKQMPQKFEHVIMCRLSKRQRFLYDDYMSRAKTRETLQTGNLLSVINVLMQLRKVCNHPNLFEVRPTVSPFQCEGIQYLIPSIVYSALDYDFWEEVSLENLYLKFIDLEYTMGAYTAFSQCKYRAPRQLIEEIDSVPEAQPPVPPSVHLHLRVKRSDTSLTPKHTKVGITLPPASRQSTSKGGGGGAGTTTNIVTSTQTVKLTQAAPSLKFRVPGTNPVQSYSVQLISHQGTVKAIPLTALSTATTQPTASSTLNIAGGMLKSASDQRVSLPTGIAQLVQTQLGKHILLTQSGTIPQASVNISGTTTVMTTSGQRLTVLSKQVSGMTTAMTNTPNKTTLVNTIAQPIVKEGESSDNPLGKNILTQTLTPAVYHHLKQVSKIPAKPPVAPQSPMQTRQSVDSVVEKTAADVYRQQWEEKVKVERQTKLAILYQSNERRCNTSPMYGKDLRECVAMTSRPLREKHPWTGAYVMFDQLTSGQKIWEYSPALKQLVRTPEELVNHLQDMFTRFVFCVPPVTAKPPSFRVLNPEQSKYWGELRSDYKLMRQLSPKAAILHPIASAMCTQFPDPRLIQYDCGKLQTLDLLLRRLKTGGHRVLIFTQMTRMLDVLEAFLNFHGHIYLRLDGTTKVDQRQVLMERFNGSPKIFAFILSTRSGGVGVNLTGADTVIFYDSDWNPTMDAQAQDRCHRIGQTRDVHIYRLVSEKTIEENILKKANQKRMLGDLAIEGGNFTTAYFKSSTIQDLFNVDTTEDNAQARMAADIPTSKPRPSTSTDPSAPPAPVPEDRAALGALENALAACEDDQDVQAARTAKAEAVADLAEFDESIPLEDQEKKEKETELSKAEQEVQNLVKQLTPIERYAMRFVESNEAAWSAEQLARAEREIEEQKREWEQNRLVALQKEEEDRRKATQQDDEDLLTFAREDSTNQIWLSDNTLEQMPMWCPPTPPSQETDIYVDVKMGFLYETSIMSEYQLPPAYVLKEAKRTRHEAGLSVDNRRLKITRKEDVIYEPRSLFDRPSPEMIKMRRELKMQRYRGIVRPQIPKVGMKLPVAKPQQDQQSWHNWTIHEDMALLKVIQTFQGLPLNLVIVSPGHTPNWDFAADYVNSTSITYRSPKQCKHRYETVILPREDGKVVYDNAPRKKKTKNIYTKFPQVKSNRPMKTAQLYAQDNNISYSQHMNQRFESLKQISNKRQITTKAPTTNIHLKNPKHTAVLTEYGIDYEKPLTPVEVATKRAERIAREKQKLGSAVTEAQRKTPQVTQTVAATPSTSQTVPAGGSTTQQTIIVPQQIASGVVTSSGVQTPGTPPTPTATLRTQRIVSSPLQAGTVTNVTGLTQAHLAQRLIVTSQPVLSKASPNSGTATVATSKAITPAHLQIYRQQVLKQQQQLRVQGLQSQNIKGVTIAGQPGTVQVAVSQGQQRQFVKQQNITVAASQQKGTTRSITDSDMAAMIKRQQLQHQKALAASQAQAAAGVATTTGQLQQSGGTTTILTHAQQAQLLAGIQQVQQVSSAGTTQVATLVKAVSTAPGTSSVTIPVSGVTLGPQVKAAIAAAQQQQAQQQLQAQQSSGQAVGTAGTVKTATAIPNQLRQLQIHQHLLTQKKLGGQKIAQLAQVTGKTGVATQLLLQSPKSMPATMTMQQFHHVMRQPQLAVSQGQVVLAKTSSTGRVIPVNAANAQGLKQTIQVVTGSAGQIIRPQGSVSTTLAGALAGTIKVAPSGASTAQQQAILSQVSAALQGQPMTVRQSGSPVRIQTASGTPLVAVTVQSSQQHQQQQQQISGNEQVGHLRIQKKQ